jgi:hypothetical protein
LSLFVVSVVNDSEKMLTGWILYNYWLLMRSTHDYTDRGGLEDVFA